MSHAVSGIGNLLFGKKPPQAPTTTAPATRADAAKGIVRRGTRSTRVSHGKGQGGVVKKQLGSGIFLG